MSIVPDFKPLAPVSTETIERYRAFVPPEVVQMWSEQRYGTGSDGFVKVIDPDLFRIKLEGMIPQHAIPFFATGMADIHMWDTVADHGLIYRFRHGRFIAKSGSMRHFAQFARDEETLEDWYGVSAYREAVSVHGPLEYDQCFAYIPILALGGFQRVDKLKKVDLITHIQLIHELAGPIEYVR